MNSRSLLILLAAAVLIFLPQQAFAYVGPGAGISLIGSVIALLAVLATAIGVLVMLPIRAARRRMAAKAAEPKDSEAA